MSVVAIINPGMGDIENFIYDNCHLKYHGYCKYDDITVTALESLKFMSI